MIFRTSSPAYFAPVAHQYLDADGVLQTLKFDAQFKRLKASEVKAFLALAPEDRPKDAQVLERYMTGWRSVEDEAANPVTYAPEALADLCEEYVFIESSIALAWWASIRPTESAYFATKNS